jgi:hypothetical protein
MHQVALGKDSFHPIAVTDQDAADAFLPHQLDGLAHGLVRVQLKGRSGI